MLKKTIIIIAVLAVLFSIFDYQTTKIRTTNHAERTFTIAGGDNLFAIGTALARKHFLSSRYYFYYYAWKQKLRGKMIAGTYNIPPQTSLEELARLFTSGHTAQKEKEQIKVTFPEGLTIDEMGDILTAKGFNGAEFVAQANNPSQKLRDAFPFVPRKGSLEGYLFPDTYQFFPDASSEDIMTKMLATFDRRFPQSIRDAIRDRGRTLHEVVTLASLVEGEAKDDRDRAIIAGIFMNRLAKGIALQSDATLDYITKEAKVKHTKRDTQIDSLYNTYKYPGLPPGPVNNPSLKSLMASYAPAQTEYLYFLNNADTGETVFAKTFTQHIDNKGKNGL